MSGDVIVYKRKVETVKAIQWNGKNLSEISDFLGEYLGPIERRPDYRPKVKGKNNNRHYWIDVDKGDFIYKDELGFHVTSERWFFESFDK